VIGTEGTYLSGGEQQRIALARAILKDAPIVVLDEATAFADPENESLIQRAFSSLTKDRTVIMIAHRLSTVTGADKIIVLDEGHAVEEGTHDELLAKGGLYARMWEDYSKAVKWRIKSEEVA
jgi:ATP-binding cassette subfamily B protein